MNKTLYTLIAILSLMLGACDKSYKPFQVMCTKDGRYSYTNQNGVVLGFYYSYQDAAKMRDISKEMEDKWQARQDEAMKEYREVQKMHWEVCP